MNKRDVERFEAFVDRSGGPDACHLWTGKPDKDGYGQFKIAGKTQRAHRVAFLFAHGRWPEPFGCHSCDNPPCCNERHLFEGTQLDNIADRDTKNRQARQRGERCGTSKLTEAEARALLALRGTMLQREAAVLFGICQTQVSHIWRGERWAHLTQKFPSSLP